MKQVSSPKPEAGVGKRPVTRQRVFMLLTGTVPLWAVPFLVLLAACSEAPVMQFNPTNRVVLAEFFTFTRCGYCPYAARALDSVAQASGDSLIVIACHRRVAGDTLSPPYVETRAALYQETGGGEPATVFDGGLVIRTAGPEYNYESFRSQFLCAKNRRPLAELSVTSRVTPPFCSLAVRAFGVDSTPAETLLLFLVICEDSVLSHMPGNTETLFNHVMRRMAPDENGTRFRLARNDTVTIAQSLTLAPNWNPARLWVAAFVQEPTTRRVLQAARTRLMTKEEL